MVGAAGFEPTTPTPPVWCATRLRYAPNAAINKATTRDTQRKTLLENPVKNSGGNLAVPLVHQRFP